MNHGVEPIGYGIALHEDMKLNNPGWTIQRIGWSLFFLVIVGGSLGLFGTGILSHQKVEMAGNMLEYERYGRFENSANLHLIASNENGQAVVYIPQHYLRQFELEQITPEPDKQHTVNGHYVYTFKANAPVHILLRGVPKKKGAIDATVRINNTSFPLSQYIFP